MENNRTFEITDLAGENLENVRWHGFMTVYAIVSTTGGNRVTTEVDYERETNPKWDTPINFRLHDPSIHNNSLHLNIQFFCDRTFKSDKYIAGFSISFKRLFDEITGNIKTSRAVRYPVLNSAGQEQGFVKFSYKFGELPKPTSQQKLSLSSAQPKPPSQLPPQQRPPSQSPQPPSSQQPRPSQRPKRKPQSPEQPPPQQQLPSQSPQPPSSQQPQRPKRQPQSPEYPPPQEPRPSSQSTQQPRPRPQPQQQGPPPQPTPSSGQQQLRPQQPRPPPRPQQQQYPQQSRPPPLQQRPYPQQARPPPPRPQQRPYLQQARPPPPRSRPPPQSTQNAAAFRAQFVATGQVQVPLSENSPNPPEPALDNHIDQLNTSVEAQYGLDPDHDNSIPGDIQSEHPENEAYCQMSTPEYENNENNHNRDEYQDNEEGYGNNEEGYGYDGVDKGEDYGDGEEVIEEGYQDDDVNNGEDYGGGEENYDDEESYQDDGVNNGEDYGGGEENYDDEEGYGDEGNEEDCGGEEEEG